MAQFSAAQVGVSAAASPTNLNNYALTLLTAGDIASVKMISWGGSDTSLVAQSTRWARVSNTPATPVSITVQSSSPGISSNSSVNTYSGTAAAGASSPAGLFQQNWNSQGGGGVVVLPIGGEWRISGGNLGTAYNQIGCGNTAGGGSTSQSYGVQWEE
jgi:hypothetical protein